MRLPCKLEFGNVEIRFFEVSHNIPECLGIAIKTEDGYLIYTANYNFDQNSKIDYAHMFKSLAIFAKDKVIALFTESLGAMNEQSRGTILEFKLRLTNIITQTHNRIIFSLFSSDILRIQQIVRIALENNKKVAVIGSGPSGLSAARKTITCTTCLDAPRRTASPT